MAHTRTPKAPFKNLDDFFEEFLSGNHDVSAKDVDGHLI